MAYPENPKTVVIQNEYYPGGLTELQVWKHYQKFKNNIISEINKNAVCMWLFIDVNKSIVKRKVFNSPFTITDSNYDKVITGRTVSISSELNKNTNKIIIDVDPGDGVNEYQLKECVKTILDSTLSNLSQVVKRRVISTANGYHVYFEMNKKMNVDKIRAMVIRLLSTDFRDTYLINTKNPQSNEINLDLTPIVPRGLHQTPYTLCRNGLMSMDVTDFFSVFNRRSAIIK